MDWSEEEIRESRIGSTKVRTTPKTIRINKTSTSKRKLDVSILRSTIIDSILANRLENFCTMGMVERTSLTSSTSISTSPLTILEMVKRLSVITCLFSRQIQKMNSPTTTTELKKLRQRINRACRGSRRSPTLSRSSKPHKDKLLNPRTGRWVLKRGSVGRSLV